MTCGKSCIQLTDSHIHLHCKFGISLQRARQEDRVVGGEVAGEERVQALIDHVIETLAVIETPAEVQHTEEATATKDVELLTAPPTGTETLHLDWSPIQCTEVPLAEGTTVSLTCAV